MKPLLLLFLSLVPITSLAQPSSPGAHSCQRLSQLTDEVRSLRGLSVKAPVKCRSLGAKEFIDAQRLQYYALAPKNQLENEESMFRLLRFIPRSFPYHSCYLEQSARYIEAFYDVVAHEIVVPDFKVTSDSVLVHELVHALQDQNFGLYGLTTSASTTLDRSEAFSVIVEGDARYIQESFNALHPDAVLEVKSNPAPATPTPQPSTECTFPPTIDEVIYFPYNYGSTFVANIVRNRGQSGIDALLKNLPESVGVILAEPSQAPTKIAISKEEASTLLATVGVRKHPTVRHNDSLGPFYIRVLLQSTASPEHPSIHLQGWEGDRLQLYREPRHSSLIWKVQWRTETDATSFFGSICSLFGARCTSTTGRVVTRFLIEPDHGMVTVAFRSGNEVLIASSIKDVSRQ